jgi:selenium metabolism protein YedF
MADITKVDCRALSCPQPVLETKKALEQGARHLEVLVDNEGALENVVRFVRSRGCTATVRDENNYFVIAISAPAASAPADQKEKSAREPLNKEEASAGAIILLTSDLLGRGDDGLGKRLMESFLDTLGNFARQLTKIVLINGGVRLATADSPHHEQLKALEQTGVEILVCGTCLNFYGLKEKLRCGRVSNMYEIVEQLLRSQKILHF